MQDHGPVSKFHQGLRESKGLNLARWSAPFLSRHLPHVVCSMQASERCKPGTEKSGAAYKRPETGTETTDEDKSYVAAVRP
jgi:hypothetical protein